MTLTDRNAAERELTTLISRALRSIPYVKLDRVDEVAESFREALDLLEANCDLTAQDIEELEKIRRSAESTEPPQHVPAGWPPVDSDDDESDDERKDQRGGGGRETPTTLSGVNHSNVETKEVKRLAPKSTNVNAINAAPPVLPDANEDKQRLLGLTGPNRPITKEVGIGASPRTSSRGLGATAAAGAAAKRSSRANAGTKTFGLNPNLPDDLTISSGPSVVNAAISHASSATSSTAATSAPNVIPSIPRGPRSGHDGSPLLTPRSIGRKVGGGKGEKQTSPRRKLGGLANGATSSTATTAAPAKPRSRFENVVTRLPSDDEDEEEEEEEEEEENNVDMEDEDSKLESKMSPRTAFNHNLKKRQRQNDPPLPVTASPAHFASSRVLLQLASQPSSPQPDYHDLLPPEARAIIGPLTPVHPSAAASAAVSALTSISSLPNAAAPVVPGSPGGTGTPKPAFLRRLDSPQSHHGKLLVAKNKVRNMLMQAVHILPKMRPEAFEKVRDKFLEAVNKLERATVEQ